MSGSIDRKRREQLGRVHRLGKDLGVGKGTLDLLETAMVSQEPSSILNKKEPIKKEFQESTQIGQRIKSLIESGASWGEIELLAWEMLMQETNAHVASYLVELVFLHGTVVEVTAVLKRLMRIVENFYLCIQPQVRTYLLLRLWVQKSDGILQHFLKAKDSEHLLDIERLYVYYNLSLKNNPSDAFIFFRKYERSLFKAVEGFGKKIHLSRGDLILDVAKIAMSLDYDVEAARLIESVTKEDSAFPEAMSLFLRVKIERNEDGHSVYTKELVKEGSWPIRVKMIYRFLSEARRVGSLKNKSRPALNDLLKKPLQWVPEEPEAWAAVAQLLVNNADLTVMLPNLFETFRQNALIFHKSSLDQALWQPLIDFKTKDQGDTLLWRGVSRFHIFLQQEGASEIYLWDAFESISKLESSKSYNIFFKWYELQKKAMAFVARTPQYDELQRQRFLKQLSIATAEHSLIGADVLAYLDICREPPYEVLQNLHRMVSGGDHDKIELKIIHKKAEISHYTNLDLEKLWNIACKWKYHDLAWRIASVLKSRDILHEKAEHSWAISGEKRDEFILSPISNRLMTGLYAGLNNIEKKFIQSLLLVGPLIPDLCSVLDNGVRPRKPEPTPQGSVAHVVAEQMEKIDWIPVSRKNYHYSYEGALGDGLRIPSFIQVLPQNSWSLLMIRLVDRLGISAWGWSMRRLQHYLDDAIPKVVSGKRSCSAKIGRWLRQLKPEARAAWYDLPSLVKKIPEDRAVEVQALFVFRLALVLNQNTYQALASLKAMRAPVRMVWQFENWLLSDHYSEIRQHFGVSRRIVVPDTLRQLPSILGTYRGR